MKVAQLIVLLGEFDPELDVIYEIYSDYQHLKSDEVRVIEYLDMRDGPTRYYKDQHPERPNNVKSALCFPGN